MIDFQNGSYIKLRSVGLESVKDVQSLLIPTEEIRGCFKGVRDHVVFTDKRVICVNTQGVTGKKKDYTSLPYSKVTAYSIETAGHFDLECELQLWFSGLGRVRFEFTSGTNIVQIGQDISQFIL